MSSMDDVLVNAIKRRRMFFTPNLNIAKESIFLIVFFDFMWKTFVLEIKLRIFHCCSITCNLHFTNIYLCIVSGKGIECGLGCYADLMQTRLCLLLFNRFRPTSRAGITVSLLFLNYLPKFKKNLYKIN